MAIGWADAWFPTVDLQPGKRYSIRLNDLSTPDAYGNQKWSVSESLWGPTYSQGDSISLGVINRTWEDLAFRVLDPFVTNPRFNHGSLNHWSPRAAGSGSVTTTNVGENYVAELLANSEVGISQTVNTPSKVYRLALDYAFQSPGTLEVSLGAELLARIEAAEAGDFTTLDIPVTDPDLHGLQGATLDLSFNGSGGSRIWLDNIYITGAVPEPSSLFLTVLALLGIGISKKW